MKTSVLISAQGYTPLEMFIGHFAIGFAAKKIAPDTSMAVLLAAPLLSDLLWPVFLLFGWEQVRIDPGNTPYTPLELAYTPALIASSCVFCGPLPSRSSTFKSCVIGSERWRFGLE